MLCLNNLACALLWWHMLIADCGYISFHSATSLLPFLLHLPVSIKIFSHVCQCQMHLVSWRKQVFLIILQIKAFRKWGIRERRGKKQETNYRGGEIKSRREVVVDKKKDKMECKKTKEMKESIFQEERIMVKTQSGGNVQIAFWKIKLFCFSFADCFYLLLFLFLLPFKWFLRKFVLGKSSLTGRLSISQHICIHINVFELSM